jgi:hypothetical protein
MPRKEKVPHLRLRLDPDLLARLEKSRLKSGRTLTGEITLRLERSFRRDEMKEAYRQADERGAAYARIIEDLTGLVRGLEQKIDQRYPAPATQPTEKKK